MTHLHEKDNDYCSDQVHWNFRNELLDVESIDVDLVTVATNHW